MYLFDLAKSTRLIPFTHLANTRTRMPLVPHVGVHLIVVFGPFQRARLPDVMGEWLLSEDMDITFHRGDGRGKMSVIRGVHTNHVDVLTHLVEHHAEVLKRLGLGRVFPFRFTEGPRVNIAESYNVFTSRPLVGLRSDPPCPDHGHIDFAVCRLPRLADAKARKDKSTRSYGGTFLDKGTTACFYRLMAHG